MLWKTRQGNERIKNASKEVQGYLSFSWWHFGQTFWCWNESEFYCCRSANWTSVKDGILLPILETGWSIANDYFHGLFAGTGIDSNNVNAIAEQLSTSIYDYLKVNYGTVKESTRD